MGLFKKLRHLFSPGSNRDTSSLNTNPTIKKIEYLKKRGLVAGESNVSIHFLFAGNKDQKIDDFIEVLENQYDLQKIDSYRETGDFYISAWTRQKRLDENWLFSFIDELERLGEKYDCNFLGWGTNV